MYRVCVGGICYNFICDSSFYRDVFLKVGYSAHANKLTFRLLLIRRVCALDNILILCCTQHTIHKYYPHMKIQNEVLKFTIFLPTPSPYRHSKNGHTFTPKSAAYYYKTFKDDSSRYAYQIDPKMSSNSNHLH